MKSIKGFIALTGGVCFMMGAFATATVVADDVSSKDEVPAVTEVSQVAMAPAVAEVGQVVMAPALAEVGQDAKGPLMTGVPAVHTLANIWDKHQCFVVLSANCL